MARLFIVPLFSLFAIFIFPTLWVNHEFFHFWRFSRWDKGDTWDKRMNTGFHVSHHRFLKVGQVGQIAKMSHRVPPLNFQVGRMKPAWLLLVPPVPLVSPVFG